MSTTPKSDAAYALNEPVQLYEQCRELELEVAKLRESLEAITVVAASRMQVSEMVSIAQFALYGATGMPPTGDKTVPSSIPCTGEGKVPTTTPNDQANPVVQSGTTGGEVYPQRYVDALNSEIAKLGELVIALKKTVEDSNYLDHIVCPHCAMVMEDSEDWGCPDMTWNEEGQCPHCEKPFWWSRDTSHRYHTKPLEAQP